MPIRLETDTNKTSSRLNSGGQVSEPVKCNPTASGSSNLKNKSPRLLGIDYGRGIAALLVTIFHACSLLEKPKYFGFDPLYGAFTGGARGVDFFFVLSGFIITYAHWKDLGVATSIASYITKRIARIYPIMWCTAIPFFLASIAIQSEYLPASWIDKMKLATTSFLLLPSRFLPIPVVLWTLKHEVLFYSCFPIALLRPRLAVFLSAIWGFACILHALISYQSHFILDYLFNPYNLEFLLGVTCGVLARQSKQLPPIAGLILGSGLFFWSFVNLTPVESTVPWITNPTTLQQVLCFGIASALLIIGISQYDLSASTPKVPFLQILGSASYSIYLVHLPAMVIALAISSRLGVLAFVDARVALFSIIAIGVSAGLIVHTFLEKPLNHFVVTRLLASKPFDESTPHLPAQP